VSEAIAPPASKSRRAYQWIKERIQAHEFTPGYRLVLGSIAGELDMSVVPVREAIRQLEAEGLVTFERNVGAHVAMIDESRYSAGMQALSLVEAAATALAASVLTPQDLRDAREINQRMTDRLDDFDPHAFTALNQEFHATLYRRCPNPRLLEIVEAEWARLGNLRDSIFTFVPERARESVAEHTEIVALIERGAPLTEIEQLLRRHRAGTLRAFLDHTGHTTELPAL
jgi:DNA-binding GntR family transcriptional regulator